MAARVLVADPGLSLDVARDLLSGVIDVVEAHAAPWSGDDVVALLVGTETPVGSADLDRLPGLRAVVTCSTGFDHIDLVAAKQRGLWVCYVPDYCVEEVADHALALLLALLRGVVALDREVRDRGWDFRAAGTLRRLAGTRLGLVGCGRIGRALASRALAQGFEVWGADPFVPAEELARDGIRAVDLDELLSNCTAFSLHTLLTPQTRGMIGSRELALMPHGSVLVNTARAGLVDLEAMLTALDAGALAGAALDVLETEPPTPVVPAPMHPRLVVTPHAAWFSPHAEEEVYRRAALAVRDILEGREPRDVLVAGRR